MWPSRLPLALLLCGPAWREQAAAVALAAAPALDIRVAKGVKERGYGAVRISLVDHGESAADSFFDYNGQFFGAWQKYHLHSTVKEVEGNASFTIKGQEVRIRIPRQGERVRGMLFADPCISSLGGMNCPWKDQFKTQERLAAIVNQFVGSDEIDFWGIIGDNFYESNQAGGHISKGFLESLSLQAKSKPLLSVPGNHDFWITGGPTGQTGIDQFGYGFMQMYGQDVLAGLAGGGHGAPYDFSVPPARGNIPVLANFVFSHQIGDAAFFGFSGAHHRDQLRPHVEDFCKWLTNASTVNTAVILGHWNQENLGCTVGMSAPDVYEAASALPGCNEKNLIFVDGHEHCNYVHPDHPDHGFLIGGNGMGGACPRQQFGFLVLESDPNAYLGPNVRVDYFELASLKSKETASIIRGGPEAAVQDVTSNWESLQECIKSNPARPYTGCRDQHAVKWRAPPEPTTTTTNSPAGQPFKWGVAVACGVAVLAVLAVGAGVGVWCVKRRRFAAGGELGQALQ